MGKNKNGLKRKPFYRIYAHTNPLADKTFDYPQKPQDVDWSTHYPIIKENFADPLVRIADIGCGYGGLTISLSAQFPEKLVLGMEIRDKVEEYVRERIEDLRQKNIGEYQNISVIRTNAMKYMPNFFYKGQLEKMFFLFPDPHFKKTNHRRRIISPALLAGGILYTITDVEDLHLWMKKHLDEYQLFQPLTEQELENDPCISLIKFSSEESKKVDKNEGKKYLAVYKRIERNQQ